MTLTKLIGKEENKNGDLLDLARKNQVINDVLEGKIKRSLFDDTICYEKAKQLIENTERYYGYTEEGLIHNNALENSGVSIADTALLAVDKILLGEQKRAEELIHDIEKKYKYDEKTKLLITNNFIYLLDSLAMAVAKHFFGDYEKEKELLVNVQEYVKSQPGCGVSLPYITETYVDTSITSLLAIALKYSREPENIEKAKSMLVRLEKEVKFDNKLGLMQNSSLGLYNMNNLSSYSNSLYFVAKYSFSRSNRQKEEAIKILQNIEEHIGLYSKWGIVGKALGENSVETAGDSISLAFAYLMKEFISSENDAIDHLFPKIK
jgi:hypothetical protein